MKLHLGAIPENITFDPQAAGWTGVRAPGPCLIQLLGVPVMLLTVALLWGILYLVWPPGPVTTSKTLIVLLGLLLLPLHEILHALVFPGGLGSPNTTIGYWPSRLVFYAHYDGEMSRDRMLAAFLAPFVGLSLLPIGVIALFQWPSMELALLSLVNAGAASADILGILLVGLQVPRTAVVRNQGWWCFWKLEAEG